MRYFVFFLALSLLCACAQQGNPTGGPKDSDPPRMDTLRSTPNYQIRFSPTKIKLVFDEWVVLKDAAQQVVVSPPLNKNPTITLKDKTVTIDLSADTLRPNTTYTINFGTAIQDFHESNPAADLRFVFATGELLDSLSLRGIVTDALTGKPKEKVTVMLYDELRDSIILKQKPYYFAKTDKNGQFLIQNIRAGSFKCVAVDEGDTPDLKWREAEALGFTPAPVQVSDSTNNQLIQIGLAQNRQAERLIERGTDRYGVVKLGYTVLPEQVPYRLLDNAPAGLRLLEERSADTLLLWYHHSDSLRSEAWQLVAREKDTLFIKTPKRSDFLNKHRLILSDDVVANAGARGGRGAPARPQAPTATPTAPAPAPPVKVIQTTAAKNVVLAFVAPITDIDTTRWIVMEDSTRISDFRAVVDSASVRKIRLEKDWKSGRNYQLLLLPGAVGDLYGANNRDTIRRNILVLGEKQLGTLTLSLDELIPGKHYILQLMRETTVEEQRRFVAGAAEQRITFAQLQTATYALRLIVDENQNGRWDTTDYFAGKQPEPVFNKQLEALKPNWELEAALIAKKESGAPKKRSPKG